MRSETDRLRASAVGGFKSDFLPLLACPHCQSDLRLGSAEDADAVVMSGELVCPNGHSFPIQGGIARFVESEWYAENFGFEWNVHNLTQLDSETSSESEETFIEKTGFTKQDLEGKLVLDVGCGMGRFSDVVSRWGATVVGIDLTSAVDAANANIGARPNVHLAQANVFELPFREKTFDYVFSIGVLHHTPNTKDAFDQLPNLLKPGGRIAIWLYSTRMLRWCWTSDFYRIFTTRLPRETLHKLSGVANPMYRLRTWLKPRNEFLENLAFLLLPTRMHESPDWRVLDTFDWYSPKYQWKHSDAEVREWYLAHGLTDLKTLEVETSLQGRRPLDGQVGT
jgi:2-polyprenyl-3-methyl-5-hydroxy-6-metoxy-1,4-benzoquinol methylase